MKKRTRRSRVIAGFALIAASAAVASAAMFGPASGLTVPAPPAVTALGSASVGQLSVARATVRPPASLGAVASGKRAARVAATPAVAGGRTPAATASTIAASEPARGGLRCSWWLDYVGTCSRTRGQPRTDVRA